MGLVCDEAAGTLSLVCELMDQNLGTWMRLHNSIGLRAYALQTQRFTDPLMRANNHYADPSPPSSPSLSSSSFPSAGAGGG